MGSTRAAEEPPSTRMAMQEALYTTRMPMGRDNSLLRAKPRNPCIIEKGNAHNARLGGREERARLENAESDRKRKER